MGEKAWVWAADRSAVVIGEKTFAVNPKEAAGIIAFASGLNRASRVHQTLSQALSSFSAGLADYADAAANLDRLLDQVDVASARLAKQAGGVERFFDPPGILALLPSPDLRAAFVKEALEFLVSDAR